MSKKPVLVVMAAGMGSRYGGLKQIDPVGNHGQLIIDYSIFDAKRAGFETVVFVIKHEIEADFKAAIGDRLSKIIEVKYAYQELTDLPAGYSVPEGRVKPFGTAHAILAARKVVDGPFAVVNADDYYGPEAFQTIYDYLSNNPDQPGCYEFAMVGYLLGNTVTEHGHVARGVCVEDENNYLVSVTERTRIEKDGENARFTEDDGASWTEISGDTLVSMNFWGFTRSMIDEIDAGLPAFLDSAIAETVEAYTSMSKDKVGALMVFERNNLLDEVIKTGTPLDCGISSELLKNMFWNKAPLHDGAVIVRDGRIVGAGCMLPLSSNVNLSRDLGMRHRAGIGISEHSDAVVVIVSEETGSISAAVGGMLKRHLAPETLERLLRKELMPDAEENVKKGSQFPVLNQLLGWVKK